MVKILHIVGDSKFGGGSVIIQQLAQLGQDIGCDVDVLTTDPVFGAALRNAGIGVVALDAIWRDIRPWRDAAGLLRLLRFLKRTRYHLVHTHTSKGGWVGRLASCLAGTPRIIHTVHGFAFHERSHPFSIRACALLERRAARWCDRIVTVSEFHRKWALSLGIGDSDKIIAIPNGISAHRVTASKHPDHLRSSLGASPTDAVVLVTGRLAQLKGIEYLIQGVPELCTGPDRNLQIWLAGEGSLRGSLEDLATRLGVSDRVRFLGFRRDIGDLLAACDLVVLPSLREGLSIALLEAMAAGKPIVTTTIASNREATHDGKAALLVPPADTARLVAAIRELARDRVRASQLGESARTIYLSAYTEERMLAQYRQVYYQLLIGAGFRTPGGVSPQTGDRSEPRLARYSGNGVQ